MGAERLWILLGFEHLNLDFSGFAGGFLCCYLAQIHPGSNIPSLIPHDKPQQAGMGIEKQNIKTKGKMATKCSKRLNLLEKFSKGPRNSWHASGQHVYVYLLLFSYMADFFLFFFNWRIIALQCCIGFCCTTTWISRNYIYCLLLEPPSFLSCHLSREPSLALCVCLVLSEGRNIQQLPSRHVLAFWSHPQDTLLVLSGPSVKARTDRAS